MDRKIISASNFITLRNEKIGQNMKHLICVERARH